MASKITFRGMQRSLCSVNKLCSLAPRRSLITPSTEIPYKTSAEVIQALSLNVIGIVNCNEKSNKLILNDLGGPKNYDPNQYQKKREELLKILPTDQSQLPPRRMIDSYDSAIIPIASDPGLRVSKE